MTFTCLFCFFIHSNRKKEEKEGFTAPLLVDQGYCPDASIVGGGVSVVVAFSTLQSIHKF
jgi:hypothetical protein